MRSGALRSRVIVEKLTETRDDVGDPVPSWSNYATRWAAVVPQSSAEVFRSRQDVSSTALVATLRLLPGVAARHRVLWRKGEQTQVLGLMTAAATTMYVDDYTEFPGSPFLIQLDSEILKVTAGFGTTTWTVSRAQNGTTAAIHGTDTLVHLLTVLDIEGVQHDIRETHLLCTEREPGYGV